MRVALKERRTCLAGPRKRHDRERWMWVLVGLAAKLEALYGRSVRLAPREQVESDAEAIIGSSVERDVALLVVGDPLCATTHTDLVLRARRLGAKVEIVQNASVMAGVARCGLQLYRFGQTVSIPLFEGDWRPLSFYDKVALNRAQDVHTLCLLDIKTREPDFGLLAKTGRLTYLPPRFMTVGQAIAQLFEAEAERQTGACAREVAAVAVARLGRPDEAIVAATLGDLADFDLGGPLHSLVVCAPTLHDLELEFLEQFRPRETAS
ncbi:hypothetical protein CTAYLR_008112 [Chrysophaeum taylorii]|uniref:diphthine methyl ester synthase n=1 Tax=Chrysophaeum taylorii TaxID=2483200 RepID=A0AAD7XSK9_9STRA|nr:hypothetical protein CTAYLR_008112 [Chrysophaeum taylorii]